MYFYTTELLIISRQIIFTCLKTPLNYIILNRPPSQWSENKNHCLDAHFLVLSACVCVCVVFLGGGVCACAYNT